MDRFITTGNGGNPVVLDDLRWFLGQAAAGNHAIYQALDNMLRGFGDNFIVQGVVASGVTPNIAITEGWIMLAGELLKVDAQTGIDTTSEDSFTKVSTFNSTGQKTFRNAAVIDTYEENRGVVNSLAGTLDYNGNTLSDLRTIADVGGTDTPLKTKILNIGIWDMDATVSVIIVHGLTQVNIRTVTVLVRADSDGDRFPFTSDQGQVLAPIQVTTTSIVLSRIGGGTFDNTTFDDVAAAYNRGWIIIEYVD